MSNQSKPLQLIRLARRPDFEESLEIALDTKVFDSVLQSCGGRKVCAITVTGHAKSGKGLLLNVIKDRLVCAEKLDTRTISGFHCNHKYKPVTEGIWIWSKALIVKGEDDDDEEIAVLLLETQGFNDELTKPDEITALLGLSLFISSHVIINVTGELPKEIFDWLKPFLECADLFAAKGTRKPFQKLSFLVRDWTKLGDHPFGASPGNKMLRKMLSKFGGNLKSHWEALDCFLMPTVGGQALLPTFIGNANDLGNEFLAKVQMYLKHHGIGDVNGFENLSTKKVLGNELNASEFKQFVVAYVNLFNAKSEMEWGLQAETVWRVTVETVGSIKLNRAVAAYEMAFKKKRGSCRNGYLREATIDGSHLQAKRKAKEAFEEWKLPTDDEQHFSEKLDELLEEKKESIKTENYELRKIRKTENIGKATSKLRSELEAKFPFKEADGVAEELVFYEPSHFSQELIDLATDIKNGFLGKFEGEGEQEILELAELVHSVLQPILEKYTTKNIENMQRAVQLVTKKKEELKVEYQKSMGRMVERIPNADSDMLGFCHDEKMEGLLVEFEKLNIGSASFKQQCLENFEQDIEKERELIEMTLTYTQKRALEMVKTEVSKYQKDLEEKANRMEVDDILEYHKNACIIILKRFATQNPLERDAIRGKEVTRRLQAALEEAYIDVVDNGVIAKRRLDEMLKNAADKAVHFYENEMKKIMDHQDFILEDDDFQRISTDIDDKAISLFETESQGVSFETVEFADAKKELEKKLDKSNGDAIAENERNRKSAEELAERLITECKEELESKMKTVAFNMTQRDELLNQFQQLSQQVLNQFNSKFPSKNEDLRNKCSGLLETQFNETFKGVEDFFNRTMQANNLSLAAALVDIKSVYREKMDQNFRASSGGFSAEELQHLHKVAVTAATSKADPPLSEDQEKEVKYQLSKTLEMYKVKNELIRNSFENEDPAIGIDLGTTYSCVAIYLRGKVQIVRNSDGEHTTPSYIYIDSDDSVTCGQTAKASAFRHAESTIFNAKRIIGRPMNDKKLQDDMPFWPFAVVDDGGVPKIEVHGQYYRPEEISAKLLKHLKEDAEKTLGLTLRKAVITVPAYFTDGQRQATLDAGELAGLEVLGLLNEPSAAALAYRMDHWAYIADNEKPRNILVFDFGGGTFDVVVMEMNQDNINVLAIGGDDHLGGEDFDKNMMTFCAEEFRKKTGKDLLLGKGSLVKREKDDVQRRLRRLQTYCEIAKKQLTPSARKATVSIDAFVDREDLIVDVPKKQFEAMNQTLFEKTISIVDDVLQLANLGKDEIHDVVLVGGSTRITQLQKLLEEYFNGKALNMAINPDEAVAYGAAIQAAILNSKPNQKPFDFGRIQEVTPMSLGIETEGVHFDPLIPRNTKLPTQVTKQYFTYNDGQTSVLVKIYQGESPLSKDNRLLGEFGLEGIPPGRVGEQKVDVTMKINLNGILSVEAMCKSTGGSKSITVSEDRGRMTNKEKRDCMQRELCGN